MNVTIEIMVLAPLHLQEQIARERAERYFNTDDVTVALWHDLSMTSVDGSEWRGDWRATGIPVAPPATEI